MTSETGQEIFQMKFPGRIDLEATLLCGQAFRWKREIFPGNSDLLRSFRGIACSLALFVGQENGDDRCLSVAYDPSYSNKEAVKALLLGYLSAKDNLEDICSRLMASGGVMKNAALYGQGMRILTQEPWECLASYIISANNNIPNISKVVGYLADAYGEPCGFGENRFPGPDVLARCSLSDLRLSKCGYRDRFLLDAAQKVVSGEVRLGEMESMPTGEAREELMKIIGVGPKIADCVLLFGFHRLDVFPVDVWVARIMSHYYMGEKQATIRAVRREGTRRFGRLAGYAQEFLFHYARSFLFSGKRTS